MITKSDDHKAGVRFVNHSYDYRPTSHDTKCHYQLVIRITISEDFVKDVIHLGDLNSAKITSVGLYASVP